MRNRTKVVFAIVFVFLILVALVLYVNIMNIPFPYLNPAQPDTIKHYRITYGQPPGILGAFPQATIILIMVNATGILIAGEIAQIAAVASVNAPLGKNISSIIISFEGAIQYVPEYSIIDFNSSGIELQKSTSCKSPEMFGDGFTLCGKPSQIEWPAEGSYYPILTFNFNNGSSSIAVSYPDYRITVYSPQVISDAHYNRINELLTIALVGFAFVEGLKILYDLTEEDHKQSLTGQQCYPDQET